MTFKIRDENLLIFKKFSKIKLTLARAEEGCLLFARTAVRRAIARQSLSSAKEKKKEENRFSRAPPPSPSRFVAELSGFGPSIG